jgi:peptide/nickel transport system substrate-binding protein
MFVIIDEGGLFMHRGYIRLAAASLALVVLAACSSAPKKEEAKATDPSQPVRGGTLVRATGGDPGNLDPIMTGDVAAIMVTMNLFDTLVRFDPVAKAYVKKAAEDYSISADGLVYTFKLRKGMKFHNGREVKAADVKYSLERASNPKSGGVTAKTYDMIVGHEAYAKGEATEITGIVVKGDYELQITLKEPRPTFLDSIGGAAGSIVPKEEVEKLGPDFGQHPVGSGPFKLKTWRKDDAVTLEGFQEYWNGAPYLAEVTYRILKEDAAREAEFRAGTIDSLVLSEALYKKFAAEADKKAQLIEVPELFTRAIHFNTTKPPFDNVKVRQAINYAINRQPIIEKVLSNKAFLATGVLQTSSAGFNPKLKGYEYNPEKAKQLLREAGLEKGFEFEVLVTASTAKWMEAFNQDLNAIGINGKINQMESSTLLKNAREGNYQAVIFSTGGDVDPVSFLGRFHSKNHGAPGNVTRYTNKQVDELLDQAAKEMDLKKRIELAQKAEEIIVAETPWMIFNYNKAVVLHQPWVHGLQPVPTDIDFQDLSKVWVSKKS